MAATAVKAKPTVPSLLDKVENVSTVLRSELFEREVEIHCLLVAILSGQHLFLLGAPGIAKSYLFDRFIAYVEGMRTFKILMTRFTRPSEVNGPQDIPAMKQSKEKVVTDGYMPWCDLAMLDEIWKANSSILNSMLGMTNERTFKNDGVVGPVPLSSMICGSNEMPEGDGLAAIYDRILLRVHVEGIKETSNFIKMLQTKVVAVPTPVITWDEIVSAKAEVATIPVNPNVYDALAELRTKLKDKGIEPTERRYARLIPAIQAEAWLDGADEADVCHISIATHCLWDRSEQRGDVERVVLELANPMEKRIIELMTAVEKLSRDIDAALASGDGRHASGMEIHRKLDQANDEFREISEELGSSRRQAELMDSCRQRLHTVVVRMTRDLFGLPIDDIEI